MLTYNFTNIGSDSMYEYLYKCIKNDILQGTLQAGEKLPSKRSFAKNLGISVITVENAYAQLVAEGYIYSVPKKGFYIADVGMLKTKDHAMVPDHGKEEGQKGTADADRGSDFLFCRFFQQSDVVRPVSLHYLVKRCT